MNLHDQFESSDTAVVTGAASGVGAAVVAQLADADVPVIAIDLVKSESVTLDAEIIWLEADVADEQTWTRAVTMSERRFGASPSLLVLNAATLCVGSIDALTDADWDRVFAVNVMGAVRGIRALLPSMRARCRGSIVTVASVDAYMAEQELVAYCSSKGALLQLTRCCAVDYAREGIRANCVCPGVIDTPFFRRHVDSASDPVAFLRAREERNPLGRLLEPGEVASAVMYLLSNAAAGATGTVLTVDAGLSVSFDFRTAEASTQ